MMDAKYNDNDGGLERDVFLFEDGLYGFEQLKKYVFINQGASADHIFRLMVSVDRPEISFIVVPPTFIHDHYEVKVDDADLESLSIVDENDIMVLCIVSIAKDNKHIFVNLKSPVILSMSEKKGKQIILDSSPYEIRHIIKIKD